MVNLDLNSLPFLFYFKDLASRRTIAGHWFVWSVGNVLVLKLANHDDVIHRPRDAADGLSDIPEEPAPFVIRDVIDAISEQIHRRKAGRYGIAHLHEK